MISISKEEEPISLKGYRSQPDAIYDGPNFTPVKAAIRTQLLQEQGYLCAYCMRRIVDDQMTTKVEHWHSQVRHSDKQLDYKNMLAVCSGKTMGCNHCDGKKSQFDKTEDLFYNPSQPIHSIESKIKYSTSGEIKSTEDDFDQQLNKILGLNCKNNEQKIVNRVLIDNRKAVIDSVQQGLNQSQGKRTQAEIQRLIRHWSSMDSNGHKKEYCGVALYFLRKKIA